MPMLLLRLEVIADMEAAKMTRRYSELIQLSTFEERFEYLRLDGEVCKETFGFDRIFNQMFYHSKEWRQFRHKIIVRDNGCDLGVEGYEIPNGVKIYIHHLIPITVEDIQRGTEILLNPEYVISTTFDTHQAIHYGDTNLLQATNFVERRPNDTCPWRK